MSDPKPKAVLAERGIDLPTLLSAWCSSDSTADLTGDALVDGQDLPVILAAWGSCRLFRTSTRPQETTVRTAAVSGRSVASSRNTLGQPAADATL